jgi:GxxExxY protein
VTEKEELDGISEAIIGAAIEVHKALGPGLLESAYDTCLAYELAEQGWPGESQLTLPLTYKGLSLDAGYRLDLLVAKRVIVEVKSVEHLLPVHQAQLMSYLKLSGCKLGLLLNFNVGLLKHGLVRIVNGLEEDAIPSPSPRSLRAFAWQKCPR